MQIDQALAIIKKDILRAKGFIPDSLLNKKLDAYNILVQHIESIEATNSELEYNLASTSTSFAKFKTKMEGVLLALGFRKSSANYIVNNLPLNHIENAYIKCVKYGANDKLDWDGVLLQQWLVWHQKTENRREALMAFLNSDDSHQKIKSNPKILQEAYMLMDMELEHHNILFPNQN
jgi:hypothetical protein